MEFVQARDPSNHSMLHQTLLPCPPFSFQPSPLHHARPHPFPSSRSSSQAVKEADMEAAFKESEQWPTPENQQSIFSAVDVAWATDPSNFLEEEFSVDELLDFGGFMETDENSGGGGEGDEGDDSLEENRCLEAGNPNSHSSSSSSALSFEPPPPTEIGLHVDDVAQLEWLSRVVDDSYSEFPPCPGVPPPSKSSTPIETKAENSQSHTFGTVALSSERTPCALSIESLVPVKAKRSKRKRSAGATWSARGSACSSSSTTASPSPSSCSSSSSSPTYLVYDYYAGVSNPDLFLVEGNPAPPKKLKQKKKRGRKPKQPQLIEAVGGNYAVGSSGGERRCSHCGVQKTPQWRAGPMGPKALCNACGVRYKSGRLLPEYRPACSPTFISHVHSNSHRKVIEMRRKKEEQQKQLLASTFASAAAVATTMV